MVPTLAAGAVGNEGNNDSRRLAAADDGDDAVLQFFLTVRGHPVHFREDWGAGIGGGLWSTGLAMARYLDTNHAYEAFSKLWVEHLQRSRPNYDTKDVGTSSGLESTEAEAPPPLRVVELGSGNGLLSACWLALAKSITSSTAYNEEHKAPSNHGPKSTCELYVTDTQEHLALIRSTLAANSQQLCPETSHVHVMEYEWGKDWPITSNILDEDASTPTSSSAKPSAAFDIIFGSDVAYRPELYTPLITSLTLLSNSRTRIYLGVTMADTCPDFFRQLTQAGFVYRKLDDDLLEPEYRGLTFGIFVVQRHVPWYRPRATDDPSRSNGDGIDGTPVSFG